MKLTYFGKVENGKLNLRNRKQLAEELKQFEGKDVEITIERKRSKRSDNQNRYWWACMTLLSKHFGYTKNEMHEIAKYMFLKGEKVNETTGEIFEYLRSSTELTKTEFASMTDNLIRWAAEHGVVLPLPNEQIELSV
jgi:hypothetical protein